MYKSISKLAKLKIHNMLIRVRNDYRMGSTYYIKDGKQRPRPLNIIQESAEQAQKLIDTKCVWRNLVISFFFQKDFHPTEIQKWKDDEREKMSSPSVDKRGKRT